MRLAILTDIHANREAYATVLADLAQRGIDRIAILGDIVGYGPDPEWCVEKTMALQAAKATALQWAAAAEASWGASPASASAGGGHSDPLLP